VTPLVLLEGLDFFAQPVAHDDEQLAVLAEVMPALGVAAHVEIESKV
jgi:hypothetical protein